MRLYLCALVSGDEDLLDTFVKYHEAHGVDKVLLEYATPPYRDQPGRATRLQLQAHREGADWVLNSDLDEFWWTPDGDLHRPFERLTDRAGWGRARMTEFAQDAGRCYPAHRNWMGLRLQPKCAHRPGPGVRVGLGNVGVSGATGGCHAFRGDLEVLHWPLRSPWQAYEKAFALLSAFGGRKGVLSERRLELYRELQDHPAETLEWVGITQPTIPDPRLAIILGEAGWG